MLLADREAVPELLSSTLIANCFGITATTKDGRPAKLAVVDESGEILDAGDHVARAAWLLMVTARNNFIKGQGHIKVLA